MNFNCANCHNRAKKFCSFRLCSLHFHKFFSFPVFVFKKKIIILYFFLINYRITNVMNRNLSELMNVLLVCRNTKQQKQQLWLISYMTFFLITLPSILWFLIKSMWWKAEIQHINQCAPALGTCAQHERSSVFIAASSTWALQIEESMGNYSFLNSSRTKQLHSLQ